MCINRYYIKAPISLLLIFVVQIWISPSYVSAQQVSHWQKINSALGGFANPLIDNDLFGYTLAQVGDLNNDGISDIAVGAPGSQDQEDNQGAVWLLFLNSNGTVEHNISIRNPDNSATHSGFGRAVSVIGDIDGDGLIDLAVGAPLDDDSGVDAGACWILLLESDGSVKASRKISAVSENSTAGLDENDRFGASIVSVGDLDKDGVNDIAVGAPGDNDAGSNSGAVWILLLYQDGSVKNQFKISPSNDLGLGDLEEGDEFGSSIAVIGTLAEKGTTSTVLGVGASGDDDGAEDTGAVWILFLNESSDVTKIQKISKTEGNGPSSLESGALFGRALAVFRPSADQNSSDLDRDDIVDLVVGAPGADGGGEIWILFLEADLSVERWQRISEIEGDFSGPLKATDVFGTALTQLGDLNGDGVPDLIVGSPLEDDGGINRGAIWGLFLRADGTVRQYQKISATQGSFSLPIREQDGFGFSVAQLGDLDSDGVPDVVTGSPFNDNLDDSLFADFGAVHILFMNADGTVRDEQEISAISGDFGSSLDLRDFFGRSVAGAGDINGDNIPDLVVGADGDDDGGGEGSRRGAVWVLFLDRDGSVKSQQKISASSGGFAGNLEERDQFGRSVSRLGDLDGDSVPDIVVGSPNGDINNKGIVWILFLHPDGTVKSHQRISANVGGFLDALENRTFFGRSVAIIGDVNKDGIDDLAVGGNGEDGGGIDRGALWILFLNSNGTVKGHQKIGFEFGNFEGNLSDEDYFGSAVAGLGDLDGDGVPDVGVGAPGDDDGGIDRGAFWALLLNEDGTVKDHWKISSTAGGFTGTLDDFDDFGRSITLLKEAEGEKQASLIIGTPQDDADGFDLFHNSGALWILFLNSAPRFGKTDPQNISGTVNESVRLSIEITDTEGIEEAKLIFKRGGDPESFFLERSMINIGNGIFSSTIPESIITDRGVEYYYTATDILGLSIQEPLHGVRGLRVQVIDKRWENAYPVDSFRLFSVPLDLNNKSPQVILEDDLQSYDSTVWRFFEPRPGVAPGEFLEFPNTTEVKPGKAFWLIADRENVFINTGPGVSNITVEPFKVPLAKGWNYIGNPFSFPVPLMHLSLGSGAIIDLRTYDDDGWRSISKSESIEPFEGYIVLSEVESDTLFISAQASDISEVLGKKEQAELLNDLQIRIAAQSRTASDRETVASISASAAASWDPRDRPKSPQPMGDYVSVYFPHADWNRYFKNYITDTRPPNEAGETWDFEVTTNVRDLVMLTFEELDTVPPEFEVWLVDGTAGVTQNLRETNTYTIAGPLEAHPKQLSLVVGQSDFVETEGVGRDLPTAFSLSQNFPNPFTAATTIPYALSKPSTVTLAVYSILGERVATILQSEEKLAGYHAAIWDGRNDADTPVASGVYLVKMQAEDFVAIERVVMIK